MNASHDQTLASIVAAWEARETWVCADGYPNYKVSSWGRVRRGAAILRPACSSGYLFVSLRRDGTTISVRLHVLVAKSFLGPPPFPEAQVAHNDGDSLNNRVGNLRWASALENQADRARHGSRVFGSAVFGAKLTETEVISIRARIAAGERYPSIAEDFGVSISTISLIKLKRIWTHV